MKILLVDDQPTDRLILRRVLREIGDVELTEADSLESARRALGADTFDAAIIDLRLSDDLRNRDGHVLVREIRDTTGTLPIVWTATRELAEVREAMRNGAYDYIFKDAPHKELVGRVIEGMRSRKSLEREVMHHRARRSLEQPLFDEMVGSSSAMTRLRADIQTIALGSDRPVLVLGPSGSGKELVARALHALGPHPASPFVAKNCSAIPEALFESELFGHENNAFTGARRRAGALGATEKGTLFLDEIGDLPTDQQAKLLRVLEQRRYTPLGADLEKPFLGRVVAATHADLDALVERGAFRHDLYMRLSFFPIRVPALKERVEDIPEIAAHYLMSRKQSRLQLSPEAIAALAAHEWKGNVRELQQVLERAALRPPADGVLRPEHLAAPLKTAGDPREELIRATARNLLSVLGTPNSMLPDSRETERADIVEELTAALFQEALTRSGQKKTQAARLLGTHRRVIERFVRRDTPEDGQGIAGPAPRSDPAALRDDED